MAAGAAALGTMIGTAPAQAQAAAALTSASISTSSAVLDGDAGCSNRIKLSTTVYDPGSANQNWALSAVVNGPRGERQWLALTETTHSGDYRYLSDYIRLCGSSTPGAYTVDTAFEQWTTDRSQSHIVHKYQHFSVKRPTSLTYQVSPKSVKRGAQFSTAGVLKFDPYARGAYFGRSGVVLKFYFKATNAKKYVLKGNVVTGKNGKYVKKFQATTTGTWQVTYSGDGAHQSQTKYATVTVPRS